MKQLSFWVILVVLTVLVAGLALYQWVTGNWPSFSNTWDLPFGTLTDLIGIGLGFVVLCLTIYVAFKQLQIMGDQRAIAVKQMAMMEEQNEASKRIETLTLEQAAITKRQGEIAEQQQFAIWVEHVRKGSLRLSVLLTREVDLRRVHVYVHNRASFPIEISGWHMTSCTRGVELSGLSGGETVLDNGTVLYGRSQVSARGWGAAGYARVTIGALSTKQVGVFRISVSDGHETPWRYEWGLSGDWLEWKGTENDGFNSRFLDNYTLSEEPPVDK